MDDQASDFQERILKQKEHHRNFLWVPYSLMAIGGWLMTGFEPMGYEDAKMIWNDVICGALLIAFGLLALNPFRYWALWASGILGAWLCVAPLIFYADTGAGYTTDTLMGIIIICFALVIPNVPGINMVFQKGPNVPPGWSYNPSSWPERIPVVALGWLGFFTARYLAGFQLEYSDAIPDPFFGDGTKNVLTSDVSESFPVSDAGLGAFAYILDVVMGLVGSTHRWRTMPWVVIIFGVLVIPLGIVSTTLVILQPLAVGSWCSACLLSGFITVAMIPFTFDEVLATLQFLKKKKQDGYGFWETFWFGGTVAGGKVVEGSAPGNKQFRYIIKSLWSDFKAKPWNLFLSTAIGLWFMFSPGLFGYGAGLADSNHFVGALVATFSIISMSEIVRSGRFINVLFGIWLIASLWIYDNPGGLAMWNVLVSSSLLVLTSFPKGKIADQRAGFARYVK